MFATSKPLKVKPLGTEHVCQSAASKLYDVTWSLMSVASQPAAWNSHPLRLLQTPGHSAVEQLLIKLLFSSAYCSTIYSSHFFPTPSYCFLLSTLAQSSGEYCIRATCYCRCHKCCCVCVSIYVYLVHYHSSEWSIMGGLALFEFDRWSYKLLI
jgi:hypothetical protein